MALVKQLAELHGGHVATDSNGLGLGARFSVWLPLPSTRLPSRTAAAPRSALEGSMILAVDDEADSLASHGALLETEGAVPKLVERAEKALQLSRGERFDVIVSDIAMPGRDGCWLARQLRAASATCELPMIAVSGMELEADLERAMASGFDAFVGKPMEPAVLRSESLKALAKRPW